MAKKIGFIGLGKMGLPMALNLCKAGFEVFVCSSKQESQRQILEAGGQTMDSFQRMAAVSDVIITIVPADTEILGLYKGRNGILKDCRKDLVCIDMTSAKGTTKKDIADYIHEMHPDITFLDAPVSGGAGGAREGTLTIMVGAEPEQMEKQMDIFQALGKKIIHTGPVGTASNVKMLNQMLNGANTAIAAEVLCLSRELGIEDEVLSQVVNQSSGGSYVFERNVPKYMMPGDHTPGFRLKLMKKDVGLFVDTVQELGCFAPLSGQIHQIYQAVENQGHGDDNYTYIHKWYENNQNTEKNREDK